MVRRTTTYDLLTPYHPRRTWGLLLICALAWLSAAGVIVAPWASGTRGLQDLWLLPVLLASAGGAVAAARTLGRVARRPDLRRTDYYEVSGPGRKYTLQLTLILGVSVATEALPGTAPDFLRAVEATLMTIFVVDLVAETRSRVRQWEEAHPARTRRTASARAIRVKRSQRPEHGYRGRQLRPLDARSAYVGQERPSGRA